MHTQAIASLISALSSLLPEQSASFEGLAALHGAREQLSTLFDDYAEDLRSTPEGAQVWAAVASTFDPTRGAAGTRTDSRCRESTLVESFWDVHADQFQWDFLPMEVLHELYTDWMNRRHCDEQPLSKASFSRRLRQVLPDCGQWRYSRSRPGTLMRRNDPLAQQTRWRHDGSDAAIYGLRRHGS